MKNIVLRSIAFNYPGFQSLPRGIKKMLVVTESFFFSEENGRNRADVRPISPQPLFGHANGSGFPFTGLCLKELNAQGFNSARGLLN